LTDGIESIPITPATAGTETITLHYMGDSDDQSSTGTYNLTEVQRIIAIGEAQSLRHRVFPMPTAIDVFALGAIFWNFLACTRS
jgi:hypothetical protein